MTDKEKAIVMAHTGICMLSGDKFQIFHKYVEDIMGRPILTHEIGLLADTIKEKAKADFLALCAEEEEPFKVGDIVKIKGSDPVRDGCDCGLVTWASKDMIYVMRNDGSCGGESPEDFELIRHSDKSENMMNMLHHIIKEEAINNG